MNSYNPQIHAQLLAAQREATDAAARHLSAAGLSIDSKGFLKFQDTALDHAAELRGAMAQTRLVFEGEAGVLQALDYLQAVLDAGHLRATDQPQSRMDTGSGPASSPLTAQQVSKIEDCMIAVLDKPLTSTQHQGVRLALVAGFRALNAMGVQP